MGTVLMIPGRVLTKKTFGSIVETFLDIFLFYP